ncbi:hypothetical protein DENSPDRAFT_778551 [Dentipellis sp. KUC8613]|nr:hypothetical protein DENSPDRAFT_778551 [Dentipellis sp. KUC8613]
MQGVSLPPHAFARIPIVPELTREMKRAARSYTRVVLRLREQAEAEDRALALTRRLDRGLTHARQRSEGPPPSWSNGASGLARRSASRQSSRAPSPTFSTYSHNNGSHSQLPTPTRSTGSNSGRFQSPLFRLRRAPLLRVFVRSPEGDWLSDASVLECEAELRKAGVLPLMRAGDVVWDTAVGDEGNVGRLVWDGRYLIDLDYTYSQTGDLPGYLPNLAFPPSYFHRVIRTAGEHKNPVVHIDVTPWGEEIAANLQLLQDRVRTETPQGTYHTVVRWTHRSSFQIRAQHPRTRAHPAASPLSITLPTGERRAIDPGWVGTVVVEAEGTNEGLADLQRRCGKAFPPRVGSEVKGDRERGVWRILRERSRPGEIWIRAVSYKERLIP